MNRRLRMVAVILAIVIVVLVIVLAALLAERKTAQAGPPDTYWSADSAAAL